MLPIAALALAACGDTGPPQLARVANGDAERGHAAVLRYDCGACHTIPGVRGARGVVAPPLTAFALRAFIAGEFPNTPENLVSWVQNPPALEPRTAMPALGVGPQDARDIAAFLYQLR
jgi:cytochrome c1